MLFGIGRRIVAAVVALSMLSGCAELDRRGGTVAEIEDYVLFVAHTKSHRLFRSYLLAGVLLAAARQGGHNEADRMAIEGNLKSVLEIAAEAYSCLYPAATAKFVVVGFSSTTPKADAVTNIGTSAAIGFTPPAICQFFDEKMARLDYALFRLALSSIFNAQSNVYLGEIRDKLMGKIPVLSSTAKAAIYTNKAVNETTAIVDDLLNLSFSSAGPVLNLLPLYRDSLELNMWLIIDNLTRFCRAETAASSEKSYDIATPEAVCKTLGYALYIMNNGNGDLRLWRDFVWSMNYAALNFEAYVPHFFLVTSLMWRTCRSLFGDTSTYAVTPTGQNKCQVMLANSLANDQVFQNVLYIQGAGGRIYSAQRRSPTDVARKPAPAPASASGPRSDAETTGTIGNSSIPNAAAR